ncbi:HIT family hydrolase [Helicobacter sp. 16-1353]|uniref:HIT family protein n=1 Tax=Helicobacter sp. 16-1353 TaxID=2004996 RepID=UPI000DCDAFF6|nr:HIT domain-containing protein [Helicobacter sp. 16-1353]RAX54221.1 HIT family hydrolase [Helicobacter sp. 16-1353]
MDVLYAPWREKYFSKSESNCIFCDIAKNPNLDTQNMVVYRNEDLFIVMNKYPYTPGHILIVPMSHIDSPEKLPKNIWLNMFSIAQDSMNILYDYGASGINMGMNIKSAGGAGIPEHLHLHLLPRWSRDTNFLTSIANTRSYGVDFNEVYNKIYNLAKKYLKESKK